jgi:ribonuclease P/MRP protein subunit POP5
MVRIKQRYLLVNILYPATTSTSKPEPLPPGVQFHRPSPAKFDAQDLKKMIITSITALFGEYGIGSVQGSLQGTSPREIPHLTKK